MNRSAQNLPPTADATPKPVTQNALSLAGAKKGAIQICYLLLNEKQGILNFYFQSHSCMGDNSWQTYGVVVLSYRPMRH